MTEIDLEDDLKDDLERFHRAKTAFANAIGVFYTNNDEAYESYSCAYSAVCDLEEAVENLSIAIRTQLRELEDKF